MFLLVLLDTGGTCAPCQNVLEPLLKKLYQTLICFADKLDDLSNPITHKTWASPVCQLWSQGCDVLYGGSAENIPAVGLDMQFMVMILPWIKHLGVEMWDNVQLAVLDREVAKAGGQLRRRASWGSVNEISASPILLREASKGRSRLAKRQQMISVMMTVSGHKGKGVVVPNPGARGNPTYSMRCGVYLWYPRRGISNLSRNEYHKRQGERPHEGMILFVYSIAKICQTATTVNIPTTS
ncbi:hypothetical protein BDK51DRAFT_29761 [Blyttiomyces helicus]|uniref:Uncharacterized protein n=1 Tax=Blyttiomyces helicus TaxID=388810 RepID=A0A4P9WK25_9FUNG|nr:hypothetical protein BDK51DRAFT_29761 [Blyttiomyces helicus]|eukprot:RKO92323.1 hypothetical protein BDK51DRAFT_29761 [Blyttiomyces helicus]